MCNAQIVLRKHRTDGFKDKMLIAKNAIVRKSKVVKVCKAKSPIIKFNLMNCFLKGYSRSMMGSWS